MKEIGKETFAEEVVKSDKLVVVDFWGPQCVPCLALMPGIEALSEKYGDRLMFAKVEAPKNRRLCLDLRVLALPTFLFYKDGLEVDRIAGNNVTVQVIEDSIQKLL